MTTTTMSVRSRVRADAEERQILTRVDRAICVSESELRYQLERKDAHPLARKPELLDVLAELEERGLIDSSLCFRLTERGRGRLAEFVASAGWWSV
ncbi:MAG: hypothetical protein ACR2H2_20155 [Solirubrobacteraceae bacterium]